MFGEDLEKMYSLVSFQKVRAGCLEGLIGKVGAGFMG
jgi:hypothetical protein